MSLLWLASRGTWLCYATGFIQFIMKQENEECFPFLDLLIKRSTNGQSLSAVYHKPTHLDRYLNFTSEHPIQ